MKEFFKIFMFMNVSLIFAQAEIRNKTGLIIGESLEINSKILQEARTINIYLPNGYSKDSLKTYPVIYLLDGSMDEDFIHIVGLVQFGSFSWINMLPESIVVGIANVDRKRDYTFPTNNINDRKDYPTTGGSAQFIDFLEKELLTIINSEYRTNATNTLIGQSLGGLLTTEILFKNPKLFDNYIIVSPSLWWDDGSLLKYEPVSFSSKKNIFIGVGKEGVIMENQSRELYNKIKSLKERDLAVYFEFFEKQNHGDALHLAVYSAFEKIFGEAKQ
ncbi:alpha/beta hydrolase [Bizionia paragorgiae]|uniref:alpha/beta hydrolase n=1 Tax=Bizionia paragorgiae TaxID=283786 RepID=UPI003A8CF4B3